MSTHVNHVLVHEKADLLATELFPSRLCGGWRGAEQSKHSYDRRCMTNRM